MRINFANVADADCAMPESRIHYNPATSGILFATRCSPDDIIIIAGFVMTLGFIEEIELFPASISQRLSSCNTGRPAAKQPFSITKRHTDRARTYLYTG